MERIIVVGDVHGCLEELDELLKLVSFTQGRDRLIFAGDLVDRGPASAGVVARVCELKAECVMGNHDEWYVRKAKNLVTPNSKPMKPNPKKDAVFTQLSAEDLKWLSSLPYYIRLDPETVVVHAGLAPGVAMPHQRPSDMLRMRYLERATGKMWNLGSATPMTPAVAAYWTEVWTGPEDVVYGHHPSKTDTVLTENNGVRCWGIDTGCCFGNKLTAWIRTGLDHVELVSVRAKAQYADWHHSLGSE